MPGVDLAEGCRGAIDANPRDRELEALNVNRFGNWNCSWDRMMIPSFGRHSVMLGARVIGMMMMN